MIILSRNPDNRETGYSNVLSTGWLPPDQRPLLPTWSDWFHNIPLLSLRLVELPYSCPIFSAKCDHLRLNRSFLSPGLRWGGGHYEEHTAHHQWPLQKGGFERTMPIPQLGDLAGWLVSYSSSQWWKFRPASFTQPHLAYLNFALEEISSWECFLHGHLCVINQTSKQAIQTSLLTGGSPV